MEITYPTHTTYFPSFWCCNRLSTDKDTFALVLPYWDTSFGAKPISSANWAIFFGV